MAKTPTNNDIVKLITLQHEETSKRLDGIEQQVKYTNGQVRELKTWQAVMQDRENRVAQSSTNPKALDMDWKAILAVIGTLATAILYLVKGGIK